MKKLLLIQIFFLNIFISLGQQKSIDFNEIKTIAQSENYKILFDRYVSNDTTLTLKEYSIIYYGQVFLDNYEPYRRHDSVKTLNMYLRNKKDLIDFQKVLDYTKLILKDFPFNIEQIFITSIAYSKLGLLDSSKVWSFKYDNLIKTILSSGNGKTHNTAIYVTKITDEYSILNALNLQFKSQMLINKNNKYYDLMNVAKNNFKIKKLFFDINLFYDKMPIKFPTIQPNLQQK
jgi:tRNA G10  N-methylase Trm11